LAGALDEGLDAAEPDTKTLAALPGNREIRRFQMPGPAIVELARPMLKERGLWRHIA